MSGPRVGKYVTKYGDRLLATLAIRALNLFLAQNNIVSTDPAYVAIYPIYLKPN
jgi:hypothetical protein